MDESAPIRAIVIGVSTLLAVATISAVLMYYNTAKQMASNVGRGQDFAANYEQSIQDILTAETYNVSGNNYITGADVKSLLNYFYNNEEVQIKVIDIKYIYEYENYTPKLETGSTKRYENANKGTTYNLAIRDIMDGQRFSIKVEENVSISDGKQGTLITINTEE